MQGWTTRSALWAWGLLVGLRLAYLFSYLQLPFVFGPLFDSLVYLDQARAVRAGRLGDATLLAFSPLYGYLLALLRAGPGSLAPLLLQLLLGLANVALLFRVTQRLLDRRAAWWAAAAFALYGPLLFFELKLMSETLGLTLLLVALERFTSPSFARGEPLAVAATGTALVFAVWARASLLFMLPLFLAAAYFRKPSEAHTGDPRPALARCLGLALSMAALFGAYGSLTKAHSGLFVPVILVSNTVADSTHQTWRGDLNDLARDTQPVGAYSVVQQARARLAAIATGQPDPAQARSGLSGIDWLGWLRQLPGKTWLTFRDLETTFDYGYYGERWEVPILHVPFVTFGLLASLALVGLVTAMRERSWQLLVALLPVIGGVLAVTTLFHPSTRYRLPLVLALAPLAGLALARAASAYSAGDRRLAWAALTATLLFTINGAQRGLSHPGLWHLRVAESAAMAGDGDECRHRVLAALQAQPENQAVSTRAAYVTRLLPACRPRARPAR